MYLLICENKSKRNTKFLLKNVLTFNQEGLRFEMNKLGKKERELSIVKLA